VAYYGLGISAGEVYYEGQRDDLPFFKGPFEGGAMAAIGFLVLAWLIIRARGKSLMVFGLLVLAGVLLFIMIRVNSRIAILVMLLTMGLFATRWAENRLIYWISLLTLPIVLNSRWLLYKLLSISALERIMVRTDFEDIISLHGRTMLWERGFEWLLYDQRGLISGLGLQGQHFISLLSDIQQIWHPDDPGIMHWHSATMEILVNQGLLGLIPFLIVLYKIYIHYRWEFENKRLIGIFFLAVVYILFSVHIDTFVFSGTTGMIVLFLLVAGACVKTNRPQKDMVNKRSEVDTLVSI
jgi:hypothetical protein